MSYFKGPDKHIQYRQKVQKYAKEEARLLEDVRHDIVVGTKTFVDSIRKRFLPDAPKKDLPSQRSFAKGVRLYELIVKAAKLIEFDIAKCDKAMRLHGEDKTKRDMVVYLIWKKGVATNEKVGQYFKMSYSAVSHCVKSFKLKISKDKELKKTLIILIHNSSFDTIQPIQHTIHLSDGMDCAFNIAHDCLYQFLC